MVRLTAVHCVLRTVTFLSLDNLFYTHDFVCVCVCVSEERLLIKGNEYFKARFYKHLFLSYGLRGCPE